MLMRKFVAAVCPLLLCLLTCVIFKWLDGLFGAGDFFLFLLKGVLLGVCVALVLPVAGISAKNNGLTACLYVAAALLLATLLYQYLEKTGAVHWAALRAILTVSGNAVLVESTVLGFVTVTALMNRRRR